MQTSPWRDTPGVLSFRGCMLYTGSMTDYQVAALVLVLVGIAIAVYYPLKDKHQARKAAAYARARAAHPAGRGLTQG